MKDKYFKHEYSKIVMTIPIKIISQKEYLKENLNPNQEKVWNSIANSWQEYRTRKIPIIAEFLKDKKGKIIDLGCGTGRNIIKNDNTEYYGIDFSPGQLKHAEEYTKKEKINAKLFKSYIDRLDKDIFKDNMFDYGLFIATLHCLETEKQRLNSLKEFYRILKSGAEALISIWNSEDKRFQGLKGDIYMSWKENNDAYMRHYYLYGKKEILNLLKNVGFKIIEKYKPREHDRFSKKNWIIRIRK